MWLRKAMSHAQLCPFSSSARSSQAWVRLELKLLGDVGLVGLPNAGKSTLLSSISAAKPKIAAYPFTTLSPNLGVVPYKNDQSFTVADIPGIIEGASCGKGLGTQFLKHIERNTMLLFLVAADEEDIAGTYRLLLVCPGAYCWGVAGQPPSPGCPPAMCGCVCGCDTVCGGMCDCGVAVCGSPTAAQGRVTSPWCGGVTREG